MRIGIGNDHTAVAYKNEVTKMLEEMGHTVVNYGVDETNASNYPLQGFKVASAVVNGEVERGIVICGTGIGISLSANKVKGIRCATVSEPYSAKMSRAHNDANMLAFGARVVGIEMAKLIVKAFMTTKFEGGRHEARVQMIKDIENGTFIAE